MNEDKAAKESIFNISSSTSNLNQTFQTCSTSNLNQTLQTSSMTGNQILQTSSISNNQTLNTSSITGNQTLPTQLLSPKPSVSFTSTLPSTPDRLLPIDAHASSDKNVSSNTGESCDYSSDHRVATARLEYVDQSNSTVTLTTNTNESLVIDSEKRRLNKSSSSAFINVNCGKLSSRNRMQCTQSPTPNEKDRILKIVETYHENIDLLRLI